MEAELLSTAYVVVAWASLYANANALTCTWQTLPYSHGTEAQLTPRLLAFVA
jgi:hypothetical protein